MDGSSNLMEFSSPLAQGKSENSITINISTSPGNNPFDSLCKHANENKAPEQNSPKFTEHFFDFNTNFQRNIKDELCGKESLGILQLEMLNSSFGNINLNLPETCNVTPNSCENDQKSNDFICSSLNTAFLQPYSNRKLSALSSGSSICTNPSLFNSASLEASELSRICSINSSKTFNLISKSENVLNEAFLNSSSSKINDTSIITSRLNLETEVKYTIENSNATRDRMLSLPNLEIVKVREERICISESDAVISDQDVQNEDDMFNDSVFIEANHLASKIADGSFLLSSNSIDENLLDCTSPPVFEDVAEAETNGVKINTETIFKTVDKMLPVQSDFCNKEELGNKRKLNAITVTDSNLDSAARCVANDNNNVSVVNRIEDLKSNLSNILGVSRKGSGSSSTGSSSSSNESSKSKDPNAILQNLSQIINNQHRDSKQNVEGQQLLFSLADILCSGGSQICSETKEDNLEDSGHSSIEQEEQQSEQDVHACYEVLDLRVASKSDSNEHALDLSVKPKEQSGNRRLSQSFSFPSPDLKLPHVKLFNSLNTRTSSMSSASSGEYSKNKVGSEASKLKPKKIEDRGIASKKGPLKAIIPLGNMSKRKSIVGLGGNMSVVTPPKHEQALFKGKRTSTPISEPELRPIAQSTPDTLHSSSSDKRPLAGSAQMKKRKYYCPVSPLVRNSSIGDTNANNSKKSNNSGSAPNLSKELNNSKKDSLIPSPKSMHRRHSASDLKVSKEPVKLRRSYSIGVDRKPPSLLDKVKQNIAAVSKKSNANMSKTLGSFTGKKDNTLQEKNRGISTAAKSVGLLGKLKKSNSGKENHMKNTITEKPK